MLIFDVKSETRSIPIWRGIVLCNYLSHVHVMHPSILFKTPIIQHHPQNHQSPARSDLVECAALCCLSFGRYFLPYILSNIASRQGHKLFLAFCLPFPLLLAPARRTCRRVVSYPYVAFRSRAPWSLRASHVVHGYLVFYSWMPGNPQYLHIDIHKPCIFR